MPAGSARPYAATAASRHSHGDLRRRVKRTALWIWQYHTTLGGKLLVAGWFLGTLLSTAAMDIPVFRFVCAWTAPGVVAWSIGMALRPRVRTTMRMPARATAGETILVEVRIHNITRRNIYDVAAGWFGLPSGLLQAEYDAAVSCLKPGDEAMLPIRLTALRRGLYRLPLLRVYALFPFGFFRIPADHLPKSRLLVRPAFQPLAGLAMPMSNRYQPGGVAPGDIVGEAPEYIGNREYRAGDSPRRLDFRAWARLSRPVVREFQEEYYCRIALVLDTFVPGGGTPPPGGYPALEAAVSLAAAAGEALSRGDYLIDVFAAGPELHVFRAGRHLAHLENILDLLAGIDATFEDPFQSVAPALSMELQQIAAVVFVLLDWDDARARLVRAAVEAGCRVKILVVRDAPASLQIAAMGLDAGALVQLTPAEVRAGSVQQL